MVVAFKLSSGGYIVEKVQVVNHQNHAQGKLHGVCFVDLGFEEKRQIRQFVSLS